MLDRRSLFLGLIVAPSIVRVAAHLMPVSTRARWVAWYHVQAQGEDWKTTLSGTFESHTDAIEYATRWARDAGYTFDVTWKRHGSFKPYEAITRSGSTTFRQLYTNHGEPHVIDDGRAPRC